MYARIPRLAATAANDPARQITIKDSTIGDDEGSSPWAIKLKTDSQEGGILDNLQILNLTVGLITYCGSSDFVFTPPHAPHNNCRQPNKTATLIDMGMGYVGAPTNPGLISNVVIRGVRGIGPTGAAMNARGLPSHPIVNLTLQDIQLEQGGGWDCENVQGVKWDNLSPATGSCVKN